MVRTCNSRTRVAVHFSLSSPPPPTSGYNTGTQIFCDISDFWAKCATPWLLTYFNSAPIIELETHIRKGHLLMKSLSSSTYLQYPSLLKCQKLAYKGAAAREKIFKDSTIWFQPCQKRGWLQYYNICSITRFKKMWKQESRTISANWNCNWQCGNFVLLYVLGSGSPHPQEYFDEIRRSHSLVVVQTSARQINYEMYARQKHLGII